MNSKQYNCVTMEEKICYICDYEYNWFLNKKNVIGVALGYKMKNGFYTLQKCIKVFVTEKYSSNAIHPRDLIPVKYKGIPTDVNEIGYFMPQSFIHRIRPVIPGYSIGAAAIRLGGTMGCLVTDGKYKYMLSNNHVLANENNLKIGSFILQPSVKDGGKNPDDIVGTLAKFVPLKFVGTFTRPTNYTDCAMARLANEEIAVYEIALVGRVKGIKEPKLKEHVIKIGKTTELTKGEITAVNATLEVPYPPREALLKKQIITTYMSESGDSGALLLTEDMNAVGLLVGGSGTYGVFNDIREVLNELKVNIVMH